MIIEFFWCLDFVGALAIIFERVVAFASFVLFASEWLLSHSLSVIIVVSFSDSMEFVAAIGPRKPPRKPLYKFHNSILQNVHSPF